MNLDAKWIGFIRGVGVVAIVAVLSYLGDATNLTILGNPWLETLIASLALAIEHGVEEKSGLALLGAARRK